MPTTGDVFCKRCRSHHASLDVNLGMADFRVLVRHITGRLTGQDKLLGHLFSGRHESLLVASATLGDGEPEPAPVGQQPGLPQLTQLSD